MVLRTFLLALFCTLMTATAASAADGAQQDSVVMKTGMVFVGRIVELVPESSVSIITTDGQAYVLEMKNVQRISRPAVPPPVPRAAMGERKRMFDEMEKPSVLINGAVKGTAGFFSNNVAYGGIGATSSGPLGVTGGLGVDAGLRIGRFHYLAASADWQTGAFLTTPSIEQQQLSAGLSYAFEGGRNMIFVGFHYLRLSLTDERSVFDPGSGTFRVQDVTEHYDGGGIHANVLFPLGGHVSLAAFTGIDYVYESLFTRFGVGLSVSNVASILAAD